MLNTAPGGCFSKHQQFWTLPGDCPLLQELMCFPVAAATVRPCHQFTAARANARVASLLGMASHFWTSHCDSLHQSLLLMPPSRSGLVAGLTYHSLQSMDSLAQSLTQHTSSRTLGPSPANINHSQTLSSTISRNILFTPQSRIQPGMRI